MQKFPCRPHNPSLQLKSIKPLLREYEIETEPPKTALVADGRLVQFDVVSYRRSRDSVWKVFVKESNRLIASLLAVQQGMSPPARFCDIQIVLSKPRNGTRK